MNHFRRNTRHALHAVGKERIELLRRRWILTFIEGREFIICYVGRGEKNVIVIGPVSNVKNMMVTGEGADIRIKRDNGGVFRLYQ